MLEQIDLTKEMGKEEYKEKMEVLEEPSPACRENAGIWGFRS